MADVPGNADTTVWLEPGKKITSTLSNDGDVDWFRAKLRAGLTYQFDATSGGFSNGAEELQLNVRNMKGKYIDGDDGGWHNSRTVVIDGGAGANVFVEVTSRGSTGKYRLDWITSDKVRNDAETTHAAAVGGNTKGVVDCYLDSDWYRVDVKAGVTYTFRVEGDGSSIGLKNPELAIRNERGVVLGEAGRSDGYREISWTAQKDGKIFVDVAGANPFGIVSDTGKFVLLVTSDQRNLSGGKKHDLLVGGETDTFISGLAGRDTLRGEGGNDTLFGGQGKDLLLGGAEDDILLGGADKDVLEGGAGSDRLEGGGGQDRLTGGDGQDLFVFGKGAGTDVITDFEDGVDKIAFGGRITFSDLSIRQRGAEVEIKAEGIVVRVENAMASDFTKADFDFI